MSLEARLDQSDQRFQLPPGPHAPRKTPLARDTRRKCFASAGRAARSPGLGGPPAGLAEKRL